MKVEATVDVGDNITGMLEQLAGKIGTTADQVFPWYVAQAHLEGITTLCALAVALFVFGLACAFASRKVNYDDCTTANFICVLSAIGLFFTFTFICLDGADSVRKVMNPNYYAMKMMTQDIGRMVRR